MKQLIAALACSLVLVAQAQVPASSSKLPPPTDDSVYQAFGQKAGIRALMEDFKNRLLADPRMQAFFKDSDRERLVTQLTDQLCYEAGGPCVYKGAAMKPFHAGMTIQREDFNALVEVLQLAMDAKGIPFRAQNAMLARLAPMHRDIVNTP
ncbi:group I truncated hemoglobin [Roseateles oligotrophus]|uniref:Group 1 truncated hemoglobin n=1 Tax=Roseateles oligotrophus TaxID=1769250 RepID=A0ABT2YEC8_9BURK|nr:group 1 truncated hemoglobin [Roseateles oligotrophus]MCV2368350.1 group 1 truncated hemoglobin [Roseateles oligotrophus]